MSLKIRLSRGGAKKRPFYRVVVADCAYAARRPLHREARHLRSAEGQGRGRPAGARRRKGQGLDRQGRAADRPRRAPSRRARRREARSAEQSGEGAAEEEGAGARRRGRRQGRAAEEAAPRPERAAEPPCAMAATRRSSLSGGFGARMASRARCGSTPSPQNPTAIAAYGPLQRRERQAALRHRRAAPGEGRSFHRQARRCRDARGGRDAQRSSISICRAQRCRTTEDDEFYHADLIGLARRSTLDGRGHRPRDRRAEFRRRRYSRNRTAGGGETLLLPFTKRLRAVDRSWRRRFVIVPPVEMRPKFRRENAGPYAVRRCDETDRFSTVQGRRAACPSGARPSSRSFRTCFRDRSALSLAGEALTARRLEP